MDDLLGFEELREACRLCSQCVDACTGKVIRRIPVGDKIEVGD